MSDAICGGRMQRRAIIIWNFAPYALFFSFGFAGVFLEYYFGKTYSLITTNLMWSYFVLPLLLCGLNLSQLKEKKLPARILLGVGSGLLFLVVGYLFMMLFVKARIELGLGI